MSKTQEAILTEQLQEMRAMAQTMTAWTQRLQGQVINNILEVATYVIPADGYVTREYGAAAGYVTVTPGQALRAYTVEAAAARSGTAPVVAPTLGVGVHLIPLGSVGRTVPLASRTFTIYGTPGDAVSIVVGTAAPMPGMP